MSGRGSGDSAGHWGSGAALQTPEGLISKREAQGTKGLGSHQMVHTKAKPVGLPGAEREAGGWSWELRSLLMPAPPGEGHRAITIKPARSLCPGD